MPACRKTRLHRVVRNLHLILLAPRERPGMRWGLATLESEDYVLCSYSPHSVTECSPALASLFSARGPGPARGPRSSPDLAHPVTPYGGRRVPRRPISVLCACARAVVALSLSVASAHTSFVV